MGLQHEPLLDGIFSVENVLQGLLELLRRQLCKKSQLAEVDAKDGDPPGSDGACGGQDRTITSQRDEHRSPVKALLAGRNPPRSTKLGVISDDGKQRIVQRVFHAGTIQALQEKEQDIVQRLLPHIPEDGEFHGAGSSVAGFFPGAGSFPNSSI